MVALLEAHEVAERIRAASEKATLDCRAAHFIQENERRADDTVSDGQPDSIGTKRRANNRQNQCATLGSISSS